jgi:O-antigen/teichoic acid export membrane protein
MYDQEAFGILAVFQSALNVAYSIGVLGYHEAIIIEKNDDKAKIIVKLCFLLSVVLSLLVFAVLSIPLAYFSLYKNMKIILSMAVFFQLTNLIYTCWNIRTQHFKRNALYTLLQSIAIISFQYVFFYMSSSNGLILGLMLGYLASNIYMFMQVGKDIIKTGNNKELFYLVKRYINFPKYFVLANSIESFSNNLPVLFLTPLFAMREIGLYGLAQKVVTHGIFIFSSNINHIIKSDMAVKKNTQHIWPVYSKFLVVLISIGVAASLIIFFLAPMIFSVLFGNEWVESGHVAKMLIPLFFALTIKGMGNASLRVFEKTKYMLIFAVIAVATKLAALFIVYYCTKNFYIILLIYSLTSCATILGGEIYLIFCVRKHDRNIV